MSYCIHQNKEVMSFLETRGMLAKLLATENLIVEHDNNAHTASFDTQNRVLKLPVLNTENEHVYNMFCAHEVGHALQTPQRWKDEIPNGIPFDYVNVIEDVRIERHIQDKFPGLRRDFTKGYDTLNEQNFFQINGTDISKLSLIDRINLHFKLGARAIVPFTEEEMVYVRAVDEADTWDKVVLVSSMLNDYIDSKKNDNEIPDCPELSESQNPGEGEQIQSSGSNGDDQSDADPSDELGEEEGEVDETKSQTQEAFDTAMDKLAEGKYGDDIKYVNYESVDLSNIIVDVKTLRESYVQSNDDYPHVYQDIKDKLKQFMSNIKSDVNHMVQQFEMKKSADAYARVQVNKTGVIDTNLLHSYKLTEDIFLRQNVTPDGKNHGMVMYVDWSGSMSDNIIAVAKQIIILVQFCRKVQIPFEVYTFTTGARYNDRDLEPNKINNTVTQLVQVLSSEVKKKDIEQDILNFFTSSYTIGSMYGNRYLPYSPHMQMGGTPLNNALMLVPDIINQFRQKTRAQKVSFVCMTDGESSPLVFTEQRMGYDSKPYTASTYAAYERVMIRDGHKVFPIVPENRGTISVVKWLKSKLNDVSITHMFLAGVSASARYVRSVTDYNTRLDEKSFRKNGCAHVTTDSWPMIGLINPKSFTDSDNEIAVGDGANKTEIKNALKKYLKSKSSSRLVLNQLVSNFS